MRALTAEDQVPAAAGDVVVVDTDLVQHKYASQASVVSGSPPQAHGYSHLPGYVDVSSVQYGGTDPVAVGWVYPVRAVSTVNIAAGAIPTGLLSVDGVALAAGDYVLLTAQSTSKNNGIYAAQSGSWLRRNDIGTAPPATGGTSPTVNAPWTIVVKVSEGTAYANTIWLCTNPASYVWGTAGLAFSQFPLPNTVSNAMLAQMAANTIKGNNTGGTANAADLTVAQVKTLLAMTLADVLANGANAADTPISNLVLADSAGVVTGAPQFGWDSTLGALFVSRDGATQDQICDTIGPSASNTKFGVVKMANDCQSAAPFFPRSDSTLFKHTWKYWARVSSASNIASLSGLSAIDGVTPVANDRILLTGQSTASQNGLWLAASGAWTRPADYSTTNNALAQGAVVLVREGTSNSGFWFSTTSGTITVGTTATAWSRFPAYVAANPVGTLPVANGGTGTTNGSITGTGTLALQAGGSSPLTLQAGSGSYVGLSSDLRIGAAQKIRVAGGGSADTMGVATLVAGAVTVSTTSIKTGDRVMLCHQTAGGTLGHLTLGTITDSTSFVITSVTAAGSTQTLDTSTVLWLILGPS